MNSGKILRNTSNRPASLVTDSSHLEITPNSRVHWIKLNREIKFRAKWPLQNRGFDPLKIVWLGRQFLAFLANVQILIKLRFKVLFSFQMCSEIVFHFFWVLAKLWSYPWFPWYSIAWFLGPSTLDLGFFGSTGKPKFHSCLGFVTLSFGPPLLWGLGTRRRANPNRYLYCKILEKFRCSFVWQYF